MLRATVLSLALAPVLLGSALQAQAVDTSRVRAAYEAVVSLRSEYERGHGRFADVNGIRLHYLEWGEKTGVPLIWGPGSASTGYELRAVAPRLAAAGYRVLAVDYRGHGLTRVTDYDFSVQHIADDLVALLDHLQLPAAVFGGASKGGFVAAAVFDHYPERVLGLLMADGGTWSNQWIFDHHGTEMVRQQVERGDGPPRITGASEFDVFLKAVGSQLTPSGDFLTEPLLDLLMGIGPSAAGGWAFLPGFEQMMGSIESYYAGTTRPSTMPLLQWSQHAMIPPVVFRHLRVPMMILDPQEANDALPVTDQNERLAAQHPEFVTHKVYPETGHAVVRLRPDWFVRDAAELLDRVRSGATSHLANDKAEWAAAVRTSRLAQNAAMAARASDSVATFWTNDVVISSSRGEVLRGKAVYRQALAGDTTMTYERTPDRIEVASAWPLVWEEGTWAGKRSVDGSTVIRGRYAAQWHRIDGRWLIRSEVFVALDCAGVACSWPLQSP